MGPVGKTLPSNVVDTGSIPGWRAKISHDSQPKIQNIKQKQCCNIYNKDFKNGPHQKKKTKNKKQKTKYPMIQILLFFYFTDYKTMTVKGVP